MSLLGELPVFDSVTVVWLGFGVIVWGILLVSPAAKARRANPATVGNLTLEPLAGRVAKCQVEFYRPEEFDACCELYRLNEPGRFPAGVLPEYERYLRESESEILVLKVDGAVRATGGVSLTPGAQGPHAWLSFGLVHPDYHGQGLGATLFLARLGFLPDPPPPYLCLSAVPTSRGYYERFGFAQVGGHDHDGVPLARSRFNAPRKISR